MAASSFDEEYVLRRVEQNDIPRDHPFHRLYTRFVRLKGSNSYVVRKQDYFTRKVKKIFNDDVNEKRILDFGCGSGWLSVKLAKAGALTVGIDVDRHFIDFANARAKHERERNASFVLCDGAQLPFRRRLFDHVTAIDSLEHVEHPQRCLNEINRVLKNNGCFYFEVPNRLHLNLFKASHTNVRSRLLRWLSKRRGEKITWFKHGFTDFKNLFTYRFIKKSLNGSGFSDFKILRPSITNKSVIMNALWELAIVKWFKPNFGVVARN